jgi:hypothetical protein
MWVSFNKEHMLRQGYSPQLIEGLCIIVGKNFGEVFWAEEDPHGGLINLPNLGRWPIEDFIVHYNGPRQYKVEDFL